ncbi:hypothetical protein RND71_018171 [Anisodus tanguticus]|uniref:Uncharacterized protein n=1 Tax=Anisodus tanguticus TaxID=243964 RepID=A0AAE1S3V2_9SOLA|nr:hypothetical protein RND71_018171 [Anisodus tanguticus]
MVVERIEGKVDTAAAVVHRLLRSPISEQLQLKYAHDILRVVALLGEVRTHKLSGSVLVSFSLKRLSSRTFLAVWM